MSCKIRRAFRTYPRHVAADPTELSHNGRHAPEAGTREADERDDPRPETHKRTSGRPGRCRGTMEINRTTPRA